MMTKSAIGSLAFLAIVVATGTQARSFNDMDVNDESAGNGVIPLPNMEFQDQLLDISKTSHLESKSAKQQLKGDESRAPVYVSPFVRSERSNLAGASFIPQESSHAPPNYAPSPSRDLKTAASYGHHHGHYGGHGHGYDHSGWLDMGAWTGGKGSFGWYADYPVGKHGYGYARK